MRFKNDQERLVAEQAVLHYRELRRAMADAPQGKGLAVLEQTVRDQGSEQMRQTPSLRAGAHPEAQQRGPNAQPCSCGAKAYFKRRCPKHLLTAVGETQVPRRYYCCDRCPASPVPLDRWAGSAEGMSTLAARRMLSLAGMSWSVDAAAAAAHLAGLCLLRVNHDTIRSVSEAQGQAAAEGIAKSPAPAAAFQQGPRLRDESPRFSVSWVNVSPRIN